MQTLFGLIQRHCTAMRYSTRFKMISYLKERVAAMCAMLTSSTYAPRYRFPTETPQMFAPVLAIAT